MRSLEQATLRFNTWFEIEEGWDYGYVAASTDGGATWTALRGDHTTASNPVDAA
jgi:bacillopeptidase F (M6 metalloprotease family)